MQRGYICVIFGSSAYKVRMNENRVALQHERSRYHLHKKRSLSFNFHKIPKITAYQMDLNLCRIFRCFLSILCMCYEPCESFHALYKAVGQRLSPPPTHSVQTRTSDCSVFRLRSRVQAAVQRNATAEPQEPTFLCVPRPIRPNPTNSGALSL